MDLRLDPSDDDLMQLAAAGDTEAFAMLLRRHRDRIEGFLYRLCWDREEALDGTQETFLRLWLSRRQYTAQGKLVSYLYRIARNWWLNRQRDAAALPTRDEAPDEALQSPADLRRCSSEAAESAVMRNYDIHRTRLAIRRLPEAQRMVFILGCMEDLPYEQIADILDIPVGTVKSRMYYALRKLRDALTHEEEV